MRSSVHSLCLCLTTTTLAALALVACDPSDVEPSDADLLLSDAEDAEDVDDAELGLVDPASSPDRIAEGEALDPELDLDLVAEPDVQAFLWKGWISDESPASTCGTGQLVDGFDCDGSHCNNVRLRCSSFGGSFGERYWSGWFSEEAPNNFYQCPSNQYMTGVTCSGSDCDNVSIECTTTTLNKSGCGWYGPYSEEQSAFYTSAGKAIAGIWCSGSNCDNKYYWVCNT